MKHLPAFLLLVGLAGLGCSGAWTPGDQSSSSSSSSGGDAGAPVATPTAAEVQLAHDVLAAVNVERANNNLAALTWDEDCAKVAFAHDVDMDTRQFFDHVNPDGKNPFDRMDAAGLHYQAAGENIAQGYPTVEAVMTGWMNSPGHRANILSGSFSTLGVGVFHGSDGIYWTQLFRHP